MALTESKINRREKGEKKRAAECCNKFLRPLRKSLRPLR